MSTDKGESSTSVTPAAIASGIVIATGEKRVVDLSKITSGGVTTESKLFLLEIFKAHQTDLEKITGDNLEKFVMKWKAVRQRFALDGATKSMTMTVDGFDMIPGTELKNTEFNDRRFSACLGLMLILDSTKITTNMTNGPPMYQVMPDEVKKVMAPLKFCMVNGCQFFWKVYLYALKNKEDTLAQSFFAKVKDNLACLILAPILVDWLSFCRTPVNGKLPNLGTNLNTFYISYLGNMRGAVSGMMSNNSALIPEKLDFPATATKVVLEVLGTPNLTIAAKAVGNRRRFDEVFKAALQKK